MYVDGPAKMKVAFSQEIFCGDSIGLVAIDWH